MEREPGIGGYAQSVEPGVSATKPAAFVSAVFGPVRGFLISRTAKAATQASTTSTRPHTWGRKTDIMSGAKRPRKSGIAVAGVTVDPEKEVRPKRRLGPKKLKKLKLYIETLKY